MLSNPFFFLLSLALSLIYKNTLTSILFAVFLQFTSFVLFPLNIYLLFSTLFRSTSAYQGILLKLYMQKVLMLPVHYDAHINVYMDWLCMIYLT